MGVPPTPGGAPQQCRAPGPALQNQNLVLNFRSLPSSSVRFAIYFPFLALLFLSCFLHTISLTTTKCLLVVSIFLKITYWKEMLRKECSSRSPWRWLLGKGSPIVLLWLPVQRPTCTTICSSPEGWPHISLRILQSAGTR